MAKEGDSPEEPTLHHPDEIFASCAIARGWLLMTVVAQCCVVGGDGEAGPHTLGDDKAQMLRSPRIAYCFMLIRLRTAGGRSPS